MLPRTARLTTAGDFRRVVASGARAGRPTVVIHLLVDEPEMPTRAGFVVSKAVGGAVVRNRVKRRLRHLTRDRLSELPAGAQVVVRALPSAATSQRVAEDFDAAWSRSLRKVAVRHVAELR